MCHQVGDNFHLFSEAQPVGWLTRHSHREWGAGNGFFPILTLSLLKSVTAAGGYGLLVKYAQTDIEQGITFSSYLACPRLAAALKVQYLSIEHELGHAKMLENAIRL